MTRSSAISLPFAFVSPGRSRQRDRIARGDCPVLVDRVASGDAPVAVEFVRHGFPDPERCVFRARHDRLYRPVHKGARHVDMAEFSRDAAEVPSSERDLPYPVPAGPWGHRGEGTPYDVARLDRPGMAFVTEAREYRNAASFYDGRFLAVDDRLWTLADAEPKVGVVLGEDRVVIDVASGGGDEATFRADGMGDALAFAAAISGPWRRVVPALREVRVTRHDLLAHDGRAAAREAVASVFMTLSLSPHVTAQSGWTDEAREATRDCRAALSAGGGDLLEATARFLRAIEPLVRRDWPDLDAFAEAALEAARKGMAGVDARTDFSAERYAEGHRTWPEPTRLAASEAADLLSPAAAFHPASFASVERLVRETVASAWRVGNPLMPEASRAREKLTGCAEYRKWVAFDAPREAAAVADGQALAAAFG